MYQIDTYMSMAIAILAITANKIVGWWLKKWYENSKYVLCDIIIIIIIYTIIQPLQRVKFAVTGCNWRMSYCRRHETLKKNTAHSDHCVEAPRVDFRAVESSAVVTGVWEVRAGMGKRSAHRYILSPDGRIAHYSRGRAWELQYTCPIGSGRAILNKWDNKSLRRWK